MKLNYLFRRRKVSTKVDTERFQKKERLQATSICQYVRGWVHGKIMITDDMVHDLERSKKQRTRHALKLEKAKKEKEIKWVTNAWVHYIHLCVAQNTKWCLHSNPWTL